MKYDKEIQVLFPTTVVRYNIPCGITEKEFSYCLSKYATAKRNQNNLTSQENDILEHSSMSMIKAHILNMLDDYKTNVMRIADDIKFNITQSWLNFSEAGMSHHAHNHNNSILSGILYLQVLPGADVIRFNNPVSKSIVFNHSEYDAINSEYWNYGLGANNVILFPSNLVHSVPPNNSQALRVSLAFNTFISGEFGSKEGLTYAKID
jgi:uncharacterized protein (TIGR02466 family)